MRYINAVVPQVRQNAQEWASLWYVLRSLLRRCSSSLLSRMRCKPLHSKLFEANRMRVLRPDQHIRDVQCNTEKLHHLKRCAVRRPAQSCSCSVSHARRTQISDPASMVERTKSCLRISILVELSNACVAASFADRCISSPAGSRR